MSKTDPIKNREYQKRYRDKPGIAEKRAEWNRAWIDKNRTRYNKAKAEYRFKLKKDAISYYSKGLMRCAICGYSADLDALCLDHIEDDGAEHRKTLNCSSRGTTGGTTMYERLKAIGWMEGLQVLCANCNLIKELRRKRDGITAAQMLDITSRPTRWRA